ncbi:hypothetical protein [Longimicrobium sp.]|uniref:hypothetical protein n=1 Tax=Longimicrobium sp. TaxID=2029185 RepID=UPI002E353B46|nr:hypothetical protein [Longimicrobium sp.]HEX6040627.1 hypothetical protein [Longimicrobium sp.]
MSKITLGLDSLRVETFAVEPVDDPGAIGIAGYTDSCAPDPASRCGPNNCFPYEEPSLVMDCIDP